MPIHRLLEQLAFGPEDVAVLVNAFEAGLSDLGVDDRRDPTALLLAKRIVQFAQEGERDPIKLRHIALKSMRS